IGSAATTRNGARWGAPLTAESSAGWEPKTRRRKGAVHYRKILQPLRPQTMLKRAPAVSIIPLQPEKRELMRMMGKMLGAIVLGALIAAAVTPVRAQEAAAISTEKTFTVVAEQINKTKFWFPSNIMVNQGDKVKLVLKNDIEGADNTHGFT